MIAYRSLRLWGLILIKVLFIERAVGQTVFNNITIIKGSSDNTGGVHQTGLEILKSSPGMGVVFEYGSTFEHIGQFYVAEDGVWNNGKTRSTDYFGYAPQGLGSYTPYQGIGIKGASLNNGGSGAGTPLFYNLELNSTSVFPVMAGMYIVNSLVFNGHGPSKSNIITTPNINTPNSPINAVIFDPRATITGANKANYINGFASVADVTDTFTLPLGDPIDTDNPLHPLTVNGVVNGAVTARYLHGLQHPVTALGTGISWVSPTDNWSISAPAGTNVTVNVSALNFLSSESSSLRLVGWNGSQWEDLSGSNLPASCVEGNCLLSGVLTAGITDLGIGLSKKPIKVANMNVWPNPTRGSLHVSISADEVINEIYIFDQRGHPVLNPSKDVLHSGLNVSGLLSGSYVIEVHTTVGHTYRQRFIRQ